MHSADNKMKINNNPINIYVPMFLYLSFSQHSSIAAGMKLVHYSTDQRCMNIFRVADGRQKHLISFIKNCLHFQT